MSRMFHPPAIDHHCNSTGLKLRLNRGCAAVNHAILDRLTVAYVLPAKIAHAIFSVPVVFESCVMATCDEMSLSHLLFPTDISEIQSHLEIHGPRGMRNNRIG